MNIAEALLLGKNKLAAIASHPQLEAQYLLAHVLKTSRSYFLAHADEILLDVWVCQYEACLSRRALGEPYAYITGESEFWSLPLKVTSDTLIPRPETELLVEAALSLCTQEEARVMDFGTGSGAIALALASERKRWEVIAVDQSESALDIAKNNAHKLGITNIQFIHGDWHDAAFHLGEFDLIVSNPPYLSSTEWVQYGKKLQFEPESALLATDEGFSALKAVAQFARKYLKPSATLLLEHGFSQGLLLRSYLLQNGFKNVYTLCDFSQHERITISTIDKNLA